MDWRSQPRKKRNKIWLPSKEELQKLVKNSFNLSDILRSLDLDLSSSNYSRLKRRMKLDGIDFSHIVLGLASNKGRPALYNKKRTIPLSEILVENSSYNRCLLKARLIQDGLLVKECYNCHLPPYWDNKPLSLQLDHINGISDDNRLENLRLLCPNCHSQTETFGLKRGKFKTIS